jgi:hypothetical protein
VNLSALEKRVEELQARLRKLRPAEDPPLLVIRFCSELNPLAPSGTVAHVAGTKPLKGVAMVNERLFLIAEEDDHGHDQ